MVAPCSPIQEVRDLAGRSIGVAGGPLDKSWLLFRAFAVETAGFDPSQKSSPAFGAPPLLSHKLEAGELDAALLFWQFCARLKAKGFREILRAGEMARFFGGTPAESPKTLSATVAGGRCGRLRALSRMTSRGARTNVSQSTDSCGRSVGLGTCTRTQPGVFPRA